MAKKTFTAYRRVDEGPEGGRFVTKLFHDRNKGFCEAEQIPVPENEDVRIAQVRHFLHLLDTVPVEDTAEVTLGLIDLAQEFRAEVLQRPA